MNHSGNCQATTARLAFGGGIIVVRGRCMEREVRYLDSELLKVVLEVVHEPRLQDLLAFIPVFKPGNDDGRLRQVEHRADRKS